MATELIRLSHVVQQTDGDCLAACADMLLRHQRQPTSYKRLLKLLNIRPQLGAPFRNITHLQALGVTVTLRQETIAGLRGIMDKELPVIAFVSTAELPYWTWETQHAVVVVGFDQKTVWLHDPAVAVAPLAVSVGAFDLAWLAMDEQIATIQANN